MPSRHVGAESVSIAGVTGGSQDFTLVEADVSLTGKEWKKTPYCDWARGPMHFGHRLPPKWVFQRPERTQVGIRDSGCSDRGHPAIEHLAWTVQESICSRTPESTRAMGTIATSIVHRRQYRTTRDAVIPIHKMIQELESQGGG
ncbi:hypothetical protein DUI87_26569 [Hirundo rustica rustica]|uniref:Uncharacterized protein n=1 Tax=Hirundo rustica rustica TaxID=333673 RepID=A0A3M0JE58_HIRRU|nr:hypothetical protein DUI87_26569 [Hirundo rustica rustica]